MNFEEQHRVTSTCSYFGAHFQSEGSHRLSLRRIILRGVPDRIATSQLFIVTPETSSDHHRPLRVDSKVYCQGPTQRRRHGFATI